MIMFIFTGLALVYETATMHRERTLWVL